MSFGKKIRTLRQERDWTQVDLAKKVNIHQKQVSSYERGVTIPSTEVLVKLAGAFNVTLDYLASQAQGQATPLNIQDRELLRRFEAVDQLPNEERSLAMEMLDLVILKNRFRQLMDAPGA